MVRCIACELCFVEIKLRLNAWLYIALRYCFVSNLSSLNPSQPIFKPYLIDLYTASD